MSESELPVSGPGLLERLTITIDALFIDGLDATIQGNRPGSPTLGAGSLYNRWPRLISAYELASKDLVEVVLLDGVLASFVDFLSRLVLGMEDILRGNRKRRIARIRPFRQQMG